MPGSALGVIFSWIAKRAVFIFPCVFTIRSVSSTAFCRRLSASAFTGRLVALIALVDDGYVRGECLRGGGHPLLNRFRPTALRIGPVVAPGVGRSFGRFVADPVLVATGISRWATGVTCFFQNDVPLNVKRLIFPTRSPARKIF